MGVCWILVIEKLKMRGRGETVVWGILSQIYLAWNFKLNLVDWIVSMWVISEIGV